MAEPVRVELTVLGEGLSIRTSASPEYVRSLGRFRRGARARPWGRRRAPSRACSLLTALDIADELFRTRDEQTRRDGAVGARLGALLSELARRASPRTSLDGLGAGYIRDVPALCVMPGGSFNLINRNGSCERGSCASPSQKGKPEALG